VANDGLLVIDKPGGLTSHDVVQRVRKLLGTRRVGHGGTLDPDATGVLLVAVGQATRFFAFLSKANKVYEGLIRLGYATDTYDASGRPAAAPCPVLPGRDAIEAAMKTFEGDILQTPPRFSAKKLAGKPVYKRARADEEFTLAPVAISVTRFSPGEYRPPVLAFTAACSAGTYIRSLAHDLGQLLGCGAHLAALRRTSVGPYTLAEAVPLARLEEAAAANPVDPVVADVAAGDAVRFLRPLESLLPQVPAVVVRPEAEVYVRNGRPLGPAQLASPFPAPTGTGADQGLVRLLSEGGSLLALARPTPDRAGLHPFLVIA
jgi:tRNA pseudouridine55 synthase